jgi:hypothetical protein
VKVQAPLVCNNDSPGKNGPWPIGVKNFRQAERLKNPLSGRKRVWNFIAKAHRNLAEGAQGMIFWHFLIKQKEQRRNLYPKC